MKGDVFHMINDLGNHSEEEKGSCVRTFIATVSNSEELELLK
jgi:hypothetical protein